MIVIRDADKTEFRCLKCGFVFPIYGKPLTDEEIEELKECPCERRKGE